MEYKNVNGYLVPTLPPEAADPQPLGKYGSLRRSFLEENNPMTFDEMLLAGTLPAHLREVQTAVEQQITETMQQLLRRNPGPDKTTDPLGWTQYRNSLLMQAEEQAMPLVYIL